jgi:acetylglutamate kinase
MKNILVKGSGDITDSLQFFNFVVEKARDNYVVVICGGGTKISAALEKAGYAIEYDKLGRRVTKTWEERIIMRDVLEHEEKRLQDKFAGKGVIVVSPILYAGSALCPINGDDLVKAYDLGFDEIYVFTKNTRIERKQAIFQEFSKVKIVGI